MNDIVKSAMFYAAAMAVLLFGSVVMIGRGISGGDMIALMVWAITYGGLMVGSAIYDTKSATVK